MERHSERGRMVPPRVFSRERRRVGAKWLSASRMAWVRMSVRVRWWLFDGVTGMGMAPLRVAMPPASLGGWVSDYFYCSFWVLLYEDGIEGYERGGGRTRL